MKVLIIALISVLLATTAYAAEVGYIQGTVVDAATGTPMPYATVVVIGTKLGSQAQADGTYSIYGVPAGPCELKAVMIGYKAVEKNGVEVAVSRGTRVEFEMDEMIAGTTPEIMVEAEQVQIDIKSSDIQYIVATNDKPHWTTFEFEISPLPPREIVEYVAWGRIPELVKMHSPEYPDLARNAGVEGRLLLHIAIGDGGQVETAYVVESGVTTGMEKAAIAAVMQFEFEPAMQRDVAVKSQMAVPVCFRLR